MAFEIVIVLEVFF